MAGLVTTEGVFSWRVGPTLLLVTGKLSLPVDDEVDQAIQFITGG
jgi:hypothetical protein